ncbi:MAG: hypothetical protein IJ748_05055, partial [Bacteroidales bacterium]|nr:hypothetical protein [Bacteroidales bacterium]
LFPLKKSEINKHKSELEDYFNSPLDSPIERDIEKIICAAAIKAVYDNENIPAKAKESIARTTAREIVDALRITKLEGKQNEVSLKEYKKRQVTNTIACRRRKFQRAKKTALNVAARIASIATTGTPLLPIAGNFTWTLMPDSFKKKTKAVAQEVKKAALNTLTTLKDCIKDTTVGKIVQKGIEVAKPVAKKVIDTGRVVIHRIAEFFRV